MSEHCGYVVKANTLRPHSNADRLQLATFFGNDTCVNLDVKIGDIGIYFPSDLQLSKEFCEQNHLCRKKKDGTPDTGYMDPDKRNVTAIKLRGEKSDGLFLPLTCLEYTGVDLDSLNIGDTVTIINGHDICQKYIPRGNHRHYGGGNKTHKKKVNIAPLFAEHADTEQLAYNLSAFKPGDEIEITLKMHGTSQRTGYLPILKGYKRTLLDRILRREGEPIYDWGYVSGTRRTVLEDFEGGYYGSNEFREAHSKFFEGKLMKGEEIYYEVVGFTHTGAPIMSNGNNEKLGKDFVKQYGKETVFSYGCLPDASKTEFAEYSDGMFITTIKTVGESDIYVYRMTMTNEDGFTVEYTPDFMRYRCEQMGVKCVPLFSKIYIPDDISIAAYNADGSQSCGTIDMNKTVGEAVKDIAERFYDGPTPSARLTFAKV